MIFLKPWQDAVDMKMVRTRQKEDLLFFCIYQTTNWAGFACTFFRGCPYRKLFHKFVFHTILIFNCLVFLFIQYCFKSCKIHSIYWWFALSDVAFRIHNSSVFILIVEPIEIVLSVFGTMKRLINSTILSLCKWIRFLILILKFLLHVWIIHLLVIFKITNLFFKLCCWFFTTSFCHTHYLHVIAIIRISSSKWLLVWILTFRIFIFFLNLFKFINLITIFEFIDQFFFWITRTIYLVHFIFR